MKNLFTILFLFLTCSVFAQSKVDSLVFVKVNEYRLSLGLNKVEFDSVCYKAAKNQATYLASEKMVGHNQDVKGYENVFNRLNNFGNYNFNKAGEVCNFIPFNIISSDSLSLNKLADKIVEAWKNSPDHNNVLIDPKFKYAGFFCKQVITKSGFVNVKHYENYNTMVFIDTK